MARVIWADDLEGSNRDVAIVTSPRPLCANEMMSGFRAHDEQRAEFEIVRLTKQLETRVKARVSAGSDPDDPEIDSN